jgi:hypothetical protein
MHRDLKAPMGAALLACAVIAGLIGAGRASAIGKLDQKLLRRYQPVLIFHPDELFRPTTVQHYVEGARLERFVGTRTEQLPLDAYWTVADEHPQAGSLRPSATGVFYRLNERGCNAAAPLADAACYATAFEAGRGKPAVYGRVARTRTRILLQYWLFYYDNPLILPLTPFGYFWQSHESDWEVVNVILARNGTPLQAGYSRHCSGRRRAWAKVKKRNKTHPVAYVALGSHANFFAPGAGPLGAVPIDRSCLPPQVRAVLPSLPFLQVVDQVVDGSADGAIVGPRGSGLPPATIRPIQGVPWANFGGRWGESAYFFTPITIGPVPGGTAVPIGLGPPTPANQGQWNPATVLSWPIF